MKPMRKTLLTVALLLGLGTGYTLDAQGSLSQQVLRLLDRANTWTALQTFNNGNVLLESAGAAPGTTTNRLYNVGGTLYWNGAVVTTAAGVGTVTSVDLALPAQFSVSGNPVVGAGTLTAAWVNQVANRVLAGPSGGADAAPTFRALVDADVPDTITIAGAANVTWASVNKTGSSLGDLTTRSASDLASGTISAALLPDDNVTAGLPLLSGAGGNPSYGTLDLGNSAVTSNTLAAARFPILTGDVTTPGGSLATTLANSGVVAGSYGSGSAVPVITVDAKGRVTAASTASLTGLNLLSAGHPDTVVASPTRGAIIRGNGTPKWELYQPAVANCVFTYDGSDTSCTTVGSALTALNASNITSGTLDIARGGTGLGTVPTNGQLLIGNGTGYTVAALTGTADQITVTNGGGSITLSTPQSIATSSTPQFARLGLGTGAGSQAALTLEGAIAYDYDDLGNCGGAIAADLAAGSVFKTTFTANCTISVSNPVAGGRYVFYIAQGGAGSFTATWFSTINWRGAVAPTLTTTAGRTDRVWCDYDGSEYWCDYALNFN